MTETHALAIRPEAALPSPAEWQTVIEMARLMVPTGLLPASIKTPEQAVVVILKGRELRVPALHALSNIVVVQGKPACSAELMLALIYRDHGDEAVIVEESTPVLCRLTYKRRGWDARRTFAFTLEDAKTAGLAGKGTWAQYPQAMLRARCVSAVARLAFPDSLGGMHTPEELGASVRVTDGGEVEVVEEPPAPAAAPPPSRAPAIKEALSAAIEEVDDDLAERRREVAAMNPPNERARAADAAIGQALAAPPATSRADDALRAWRPPANVDELVGPALTRVCERLRDRVLLEDVPCPRMPTPYTNEGLHAWWRDAVAVLSAAGAAG